MIEIQKAHAEFFHDDLPGSGRSGATRAHSNRWFLVRFQSLLTCIVEEAINAVLNRITIRSIKGNVVIMDVVAAGRSDDRAILVANVALSGVVARRRGGGSDSMERE